MKRTNTILVLGTLILAVLAFSCTKDENPSVGFTLKATGTTAPTDDELLQGSDNPEPLQLEWNTAWIYITHLDFRAQYFGLSDLMGKDTYPDVHIEWQGNQKVDLLSEPLTFGTIEIPEGNFKNFSLVMTSARLGTYNEPNFYLEGNYGPIFGGTPISVSVTEEFDMELNYDGEQDISTSDAYLFEGLISFSLDHVFDGITSEDLDKAEKTDGWILISASHNQDLYSKILENLHTTAESSFTWGLHTIY